MAMEKNTCQVCRYQSQLGAIEEHHIIPTQVTERAGVPPSQTLRLCCNCHREVHDWCLTKVSGVTYDSKAKAFRDRSWLEMVKEYQSVFNSFAKYKKEQREASPPSPKS